MKTRHTLSVKALILLVFAISLYIVHTTNAQDIQEIRYPTELLLIRFTEPLVDMPEPEGMVSIESIAERASFIRNYLHDLDPEAEISRYRPEFQPSDTLTIDIRGEVIRRKDWSLVYWVHLTKIVPFFEVKSELEQDLFIEWVSLPARVLPLAVPNDLHKELHQWNLNTVNAIHAWDITKGSEDIRIMILDDGIRSHADINNKVVNSANNPVYGNHGLSVAGVAGAETDNNLGLASLGWKTSLVTAPFQFMSDTAAFAEQLVEYFEASFDPGSEYYSHIINCSFYTPICANQSCTEIDSHNYEQVQEAVEEALINGRIIIAAAGNPPREFRIGGHLIWKEIFTIPLELWPAAYNGVISVSPTNSDDEFEEGYNYGSFVDINAPGIDVPTLVIDDFIDYDHRSGTSYSAPHISATVALMLSTNPNLTSDEIRTILQHSADKVGQYSYDANGWNQYMGYGRLNAFRAVTRALPLQYANSYFTSSTTLSNHARIYGSTYISPGVIITVPFGKVAVLEGTITGGTNAEIRANGKIVVAPNANIKGVKITIEGGAQLIANNATFDLNGQSGNAVSFKSGSGGSINQSTIRNATRGIDINNAAVSVKNSTIEYNSSGIWLTNTSLSEVEIIDNNILPNSTHGIASYYSSAKIKNNWIESVYGSYGIFALGSTHDVVWNDIRKNSNGIFLLNNSTFLGTGMNRMVDNPTALYAESPVYVSFNYNDVYPTGTGYLNVRANLYAYVGASNAYWGQYPPNPAHFLATNGAYIAYLPGAQSPYRNPPSKIMASSHGANTSMESQLVSHTNLATDQSAPDSIIEEAIQLMNQDRYEEAIALLKQGLREAETRIEKQYLLSLLAACYRTTEKEGFFDFLDGEIVTGISGHDDLYATTLEIKNLFLIRDGNYQSAIENYQVLREEFSSHALFHKSALFGLGYVYTEMLNQPERGKEYFIELVSTYPEDALTEAAILTMSQYNESLEEFLVNGSSAEIPDKPVLFDNFPNPFNPATVIRFSIPDNERITLRVYDILGRVVAVLADDIYESGTHQITFDASRLPSGVYFSRIDFAGQSLVQRMLLVK